MDECDHAIGDFVVGRGDVTIDGKLKAVFFAIVGDFAHSIPPAWICITVLSSFLIVLGQRVIVRTASFMGRRPLTSRIKSVSVVPRRAFLSPRKWVGGEGAR
jgi:hypothetical protein